MKTMYVIMSLACVITILAIVAPTRVSGNAHDAALVTVANREVPLALAEIPAPVASEGFAGPQLSSSERDRVVERWSDMLCESDPFAVKLNETPGSPKLRAKRTNDSNASKSSHGNRHSGNYKNQRVARVTEKSRPAYYGASRHARERLFLKPVIRNQTRSRVYSISR